MKNELPIRAAGHELGTLKIACNAHRADQHAPIMERVAVGLPGFDRCEYEKAHWRRGGDTRGGQCAEQYKKAGEGVAHTEIHRVMAPVVAADRAAELRGCAPKTRPGAAGCAPPPVFRPGFRVAGN